MTRSRPVGGAHDHAAAFRAAWRARCNGLLRGDRVEPVLLTRPL